MQNDEDMQDAVARVPDEALAGRVSRFHLRQRLGIEEASEARVFGQGFNFFHIENWYSIHAVIRYAIAAVGQLGCSAGAGATRRASRSGRTRSPCQGSPARWTE